LHQNSILATVQSFQARFWQGRAGRIASEIPVQTVSSDLFWQPWCFWKGAQGSPCQSKQMQAITKQCTEILHQNSILATVQSFQAGIWRGLAGRIASETPVQTVSSL
jgi:hypothetical protein